MQCLFSSSVTQTNGSQSDRIVCEKSTQISQDDNPLELQQQSTLQFTLADQTQYPRKNYIGLSLPQWYRPKAASTLLRKRNRSRQWITYDIETDPGRKKVTKKIIEVPSTVHNQLESHSINFQSAVKNVKTILSSESTGSQIKKVSTPKYHLMKGFVSDTDENANGRGDQVIDETESQQKVKLVVLLLMIPSIAVMFYSQSKFKRESNVVGDLSGLGLPHNYLANGMGPGSFGSRDFTSKFNPLYDQMKSDQSDDYDSFENHHHHPHQPKPNHNHNHNQIDNHHKLFEELTKTHNQATINNQHNNDNKNRATIKSNEIVKDEESVTGDNPLDEESKLLQVKIEDLKTNSGYKIILHETADQLNNYNYLPTSELSFTHCPNEKRCLITNDIKLINISDAIIYTDHHLCPSNYNHLKRQLTNNNNLISIFYSLSPIEWTNSLQSKSNLTLTYNYQSNITYRPIRIEKGLLDGVRRQKSDQNDGESDNLNGTNAFDLWRNKSKLVLIVTYNCTIDLELINFATIMERTGIDVDLVSLCDEKICPSRDDHSSLEKCFQSISEPYLFLFAWESLICPQFVSPLVYQALANNLIPIVAHSINSLGNNYNLPESSFINSLDFTSLHELSNHLNLIASDLNQYSPYIQWKETLEISLTRNDLCHLCSALHGNHAVLNLDHTSHDKSSSSSSDEQKSVNQQCTYWKNVYTFTEIKGEFN